MQLDKWLNSLATLLCTWFKYWSVSVISINYYKWTFCRISPPGRFSKATLQNCLRPLVADLHKGAYTHRAGLKLSSARRALMKKEANEQWRRCNAFVLVCAPPMNEWPKRNCETCARCTLCLILVLKLRRRICKMASVCCVINAGQCHTERARTS
jgi:hypothetical protein